MIFQHNNTQFGIDLNIIWNIIKFAFLLNLYTLLIPQSTSICNKLNFLFTLSKLVRPLMMLSFNSPKPTKGLDALIISLFLVIDDNTIKAYKRLINNKIFNPMV